MNASLCELLDDYVAHDLTGDERARFAAHLSDCAACRRAVDEQRRLDSLLVEATARLVSVPASLAERVERRLRIARSRRLAAGVALLAATAAAICIWLRNPPPTDAPTPPARVQPEAPPSELPLAVDPVRVTFPADANVLVV